MKCFMLFAAAVVFACSFGAPAGADVYSLTFDEPWARFDDIPDSYGDQAGMVDVGYRRLDGFGNAVVLDQHLQWWDTSNLGDGQKFGDLAGVAWGNSGIEVLEEVGEIAFAATAGNQVTLSAFDIAGWSEYFIGGTDFIINVTVYDGDYAPLWTSGDVTIPEAGDGHFGFAPAVTAPLLRLQWQLPYGAAVDNVGYEVSPVPEPATVIGWLVGLTCLGLVGFRRFRQV